MATGSSLTQNHSRSQSGIQRDLHNGAQRINPKNRVVSEIPAQLACAYFKGPLKGRALDWLEVLGYSVIENKATDYVHLRRALLEQFPVVRNSSELETRFYSSSQRCDQQPSDIIYELLKIHKHCGTREGGEIFYFGGGLPQIFSYRPRQKTKDRVVTAQGVPCSHLGRVNCRFGSGNFRNPGIPYSRQHAISMHLINRFYEDVTIDIGFSSEILKHSRQSDQTIAENRKAGPY
ncbi:uncharacterized protein TNCV_1836031 [Trichonephila clavipes]|nr:uncharacterized protein TNCV_1836031 [Trichonephila clavipes]